MEEDIGPGTSGVMVILQVLHGGAFRNSRQCLEVLGMSGTMPMWGRVEVARSFDLLSTESLARDVVNSTTTDLFCFNPNFPSRWNRLMAENGDVIWRIVKI